MIYALIVGLVGCYVGGIPFGPLNLSVVDITLNRNYQHALKFSYAAAMVEIVHAFIALQLSMLATSVYSNSKVIGIVTTIVLLVIGIFYLLKKNNVGAVKRVQGSEFIKGLILSSLNPQAIPYWLFVFAFVHTQISVSLSGLNTIWLLTGVMIGKFLILNTYGLVSNRLGKNLGQLKTYTSKIIGVILLGLAIFQGVKVSL